LGWTEIDAIVLSVNDIKAEKIEIAENLFRVDLTVLERGQQLKRLKEFYEAEHPQTKQGMRNAQTSKNAESAFLETPAFAKVTAEKINKSERVIQEEVQVATRIPEKVQTLIKDLPVADNK
jgi:ParB family chromosome partitioning protein